MEPVRWKERLAWRILFGQEACSVDCGLVRLVVLGESILVEMNQGWHKKPKPDVVAVIYRSYKKYKIHNVFWETAILSECSPLKGRSQQDEY